MANLLNSVINTFTNASIDSLVNGTIDTGLNYTFNSVFNTTYNKNGTEGAIVETIIAGLIIIYNLVLYCLHFITFITLHYYELYDLE